MKKILIGDVSLRYTLGSEGPALSFKEKLEIAKRLDELNVDVIELGALGNDKADVILVKTIAQSLKKSTLACTVGVTEESVDKSYLAISSAKGKRLVVSIPVSPVQMEYNLKKKPAKVIELLASLTKKATSVCEDVEVSLEDATRAEPSFLYQSISVAIENGAKTVTLVDIAGALLPEEFAEFIKDAYKNVQALSNVNLGVCCSDEFSFATANTLSALAEGAVTIKVSALSNLKTPSIEKISSVMDYVGAKKGFTCDLNKTAISRTVSQIAQLCHVKNEYQVMNENKETVKETITKKTTASSLSKIIKKLGYDLSNEDLKKVYEEFVRLSNKKQVSVKELDVIIASVALQVPETYSLINFSVQSSNLLTSTASVTLKKDGKEISGLSFGNGSVDAAFLALENVIGRHFELDGFELGAVTEGKEAMGQALVKLRSDGKIYSGRGVSTDIIGASIRAYVNAINKIVHEEQE